MPETLDLPTIDASALDRAEKQALAEQPVSQQLAPITPTPPDLTKIDLTDVALAQFGDWRDDVKKTKANLSTLVLDLSTPTKIKEARTLRTRMILDPLAALRKVSATIKSKMAQTSKQVGLELTLAEAGYEEADGLILPQIVKAEEEMEREREEARKAEEARKEKHRTNLEAIRIYIDRASAPGMTADRIAKGIAQLEALPTPTKEAWDEFAVQAAGAICGTLDKMRQLHAKALADEAAEAERVRRAAELAEQERRLAAERAEIERQRAELEAARALQAQQAAKAPAAVFGIDQASPNGDMGAKVEGVRNDDGTLTITKIEYTEGRASQQVLKAEPATADATDRDAPAMTSPRVGEMGAGQAADAAPAGGSPELAAALGSIAGLSGLAPVVRAPGGPFTLIEQGQQIADPRDALLREALALTKYAAAPFFGKFPTHPKTTPEWWAGLREQIEALQPKLIEHIEGLQ